MAFGVDAKARLIFTALLVTAAIAAGAWYWARSSRYDSYAIYTKDAVSGLLLSAPVEFHGVEVGKVQAIELLEPRLVRIVLSLDRKAPLSSASVATITSRGLATRGFTGYVFIAIEDSDAPPASIEARPDEPLPLIATAPSRVITLDTNMDQLAESARLLAQLATGLLDRPTVSSLKGSADSLQRVLPQLQQALSALIELEEKLNRDPSILVRGAQPPPPGPGEKK